MKIFFKRGHVDAKIPCFGNKDTENAGIDFFSIEEKTIPAGGEGIFNTGISWEPQKSRFFKIAMLIQGRSGMAVHEGIECSNAGVIDQGYRGEIKIKLYNTSKEDKTVVSGQRIAQGIIYMLPNIKILEAMQLSHAKRGNKGFGSSGR